MSQATAFPTLRALLIAAALPFVAALVLTWPLLDGSFLSDDYWWGTLLDHRAPGASVLWSEVWRDFTGPWLGAEVGVFYRPLVTLAIGINFALGDGSPLPFHVLNVAEHALASASCGLICALVCPSRAALAGILGGLLFALHPSAIEPVAWCSSVTSTQEVLFRLSALAGYAWFLSTRARRAFVVSLVFALLALFTKESALTLPAALLAVDLLHPARSTWRGVVARLTPFVLLCGLYLAIRLSLPGFAVSVNRSAEDFLATLPTTTPSKLVALLLPFGIDAPLLANVAFWVAGAWLVWVFGEAVLRARLALAVITAWILVQLLPSAAFAVLPNYFGSRMVYGLVPSLALLAVVVLLRPQRALRWLPVISLVAIAAFATVARDRVVCYERAFADADRCRDELNRVAADATPQRPVAPLTVPEARDGILRISEEFVFAMAERPWAPVDRPVVNLNFIGRRIAGSEALEHDPSPLRALHELGAMIVSWDEAGGSWIRAPHERREVRLRRGGEGLRWLVDGEPADPLDIEAVVVAAPAGMVGGGLRWSSAAGGGELALGVARVVEGRRVFTVDVTHDLTFVLQRLVGGITGFEVEGVGVDAGAVELGVVPRLHEAPTARRLDGAAVAVEQLWTGLPRPEVPAGGKPGRLVLLAATTGLVVPVVDGELAPSQETTLHLHKLLRVSRQKLVWCYWESGPGEGLGTAWRTRVDWFRLTSEGPRRRIGVSGRR